jgi:hypothetical protein
MAWSPSKLIGVKKNNNKILNKEEYRKGVNRSSIWNHWPWVAFYK